MKNYKITWFTNRTKHTDEVLAGSGEEAVDILKDIYGDELIVMMIESYDFIYCC